MPVARPKDLRGGIYRGDLWSVLSVVTSDPAEDMSGWSWSAHVRPRDGQQAPAVPAGVAAAYPVVGTANVTVSLSPAQTAALPRGTEAVVWDLQADRDPGNPGANVLTFVAETLDVSGDVTR